VPGGRSAIGIDGGEYEDDWIISTMTIRSRSRSSFPALERAQFLMARAQMLTMMATGDAAAYLRTELLDALKTPPEPDPDPDSSVWGAIGMPAGSAWRVGGDAHTRQQYTASWLASTLGLYTALRNSQITLGSIT